VVGLTDDQWSRIRCVQDLYTIKINFDLGANMAKNKTNFGLLPYRVLVGGMYSLHQLKLEYDEHNILNLSGVQQEEVERVVSTYMVQGKQIDYDADGHRPPLYRLISYSVNGGNLVLRLGKTDFGEYLATNVEHPEWREIYGDEVMSDALAFSVAAVTADNFLLWGKRSGKPADAAGAYHVLPSGHPHPPGSIGIWLYQELEAEAGIQVDEISDLICTGLVLSLWNTKPELTFFLRASVTFAELQERKRTEGWEFAEVYGLLFTNTSVREWLADYKDRLVPSGHAAVLLAGRINFGDKWWYGAIL
ncbi:hypothetical protein, partial [Vibrio sp.]|uniref:hypothetical protein n=1 Tax=Vibrio sp. TaxID=678 RepID=UPI003D11EA22